MELIRHRPQLWHDDNDDDDNGVVDDGNNEVDDDDGDDDFAGAKSWLCDPFSSTSAAPSHPPTCSYCPCHYYHTVIIIIILSFYKCCHRSHDISSLLITETNSFGPNEFDIQ